MFSDGEILSSEVEDGNVDLPADQIVQFVAVPVEVPLDNVQLSGGGGLVEVTGCSLQLGHGLVDGDLVSSNISGASVSACAGALVDSVQ